MKEIQLMKNARPISAECCMIAASWVDCRAGTVRACCLLVGWTPEHAVRLPNDAHDYNPHYERLDGLR